MNIIITGAGGQLANELVATAPTDASVHALSEVDLDIRDRDRVLAAVRERMPTVIFNAAAYTAVDRAESERDLAFAVNADGARHLAEASRAVGAYLVHVSTDFVFDGASGTPCDVDATPRPLSVYGASKLAGELAVRGVDPEAAIIRTAWVYAACGKNFVHTMLRLMKERGAVRVVADQVGSPTHARGLAEACWRAFERRTAGTLHWTDAGVASWYDFAVAIAEFGCEANLLPAMPTIEPIRTVDYPTPAERPKYSVLDKSSTWDALAMRPPHWRIPLQRTIGEIAHA
ncbi:MAG: dTDP-4-dehydrorhamnose reductase [Phycisphaerae bacterium]|nr:dTDP-4-dehydrorhamnose reductase [Phycisphaerae bacterium]